MYGKDIDAAEIIDGQQRLTTLQIFLAAFRDIAEEMAADRLYAELVDLTRNRHVADDSHQRFKVWPTNADRSVFESVMTAGSADVVQRRHPQVCEGRKKLHRPRLVEAHLFFYSTIKQFLRGSGGEPQSTHSPLSRLDAIFEAFRRRLQVVVIDLEDEDDPQVIFETLNARGVPLLPSDLIRNYVFLNAKRNGEDVDQLYNKLWRHYDDEPAEAAAKGPEQFWKREEKQGRFKRPRLDLFFQHYLTYQTGEDVNVVWTTRSHAA